MVLLLLGLRRAPTRDSTTTRAAREVAASGATLRQKMLVAAALVVVDALKCHCDRVFPALHQSSVLLLVDYLAGYQVARHRAYHCGLQAAAMRHDVDRRAFHL